MITVSVHQIYLVNFDLPQFLLVVISKLFFTLSSQAQMLTYFIPQSRSQSPRYPCPAERETRDSGLKRFG